MTRRRLRLVLVISLGLGIVVLIALHLLFSVAPRTNIVWGVSFDPAFAREIGVDGKAVYHSLLYDWGFRHIRLSARWNAIETAPGVYDFRDLDNLMNEAEKKGAKIMLAVGQKVPRWPECHLPSWWYDGGTVHNNDQFALQRQAARLAFVQAVVSHYRAHPALEIWQVENESLFPFGTCPTFTAQDLIDEIALVHSLDPSHQTITTDSGELSLWRNTAKAADLFGMTSYRVVWNKWFGFLNYEWMPASFYRFKLRLNGRSYETAYVTELQAEPWATSSNGLLGTSAADQDKSLNAIQLKKNIAFAEKIGLPRVYLWGSEWWYWLGLRGQKDIIDIVRTLPKG